MVEFLLYTSIKCADADALMLRIKANDNLSPVVRLELVETIKDSAPHCEYYWDAND